MKMHSQEYFEVFFCSSNRKGKIVCWLRIAHLSTSSKYLQYFVQTIQFIMFSFAHCFISILIPYIFVIVGWEQLEWLHMKFHYT